MKDMYKTPTVSTLSPRTPYSYQTLQFIPLFNYY